MSKTRNRILLYAGAASLAGLTLLGCSLKARPADSAGFVDYKRMAKRPALPFHLAWYKEGVDWSGYKRIYFAPVDISHLKKMSWWKSSGRSEEKILQDAQRVAEYTRGVFEKAFQDDPRKRFLLADAPGPSTLTAEIALTEIVPSKVTLNTIGYVPVVGSAAKFLRNTTSKSCVAFEAKVRDGSTGEILAMYADKEQEKMAPANLNDLTWFGHAFGIIDEWALQFVQTANKKKGTVVKDSAGFTLKPW